MQNRNLECLQTAYNTDNAMKSNFSLQEHLKAAQAETQPKLLKEPANRQLRDL